MNFEAFCQALGASVDNARRASDPEVMARDVDAVRAKVGKFFADAGIPLTADTLRACLFGVYCVRSTVDAAHLHRRVTGAVSELTTPICVDLFLNITAVEAEPPALVLVDGHGGPVSQLPVPEGNAQRISAADLEESE